MNSAELLDSRKALMPLSATKSEVNHIADYVYNFSCTNVIATLNKKICMRNVSNILLIGSGDSYALALLYAALFNQITGLNARGVQSFEFIGENSLYLDKTWLIIIISASGRPSPVVNALEKAQTTDSQVIGITNSEGSVFANLARTPICTGATKKGMPTFSNIAAALHLDAIACLLFPDYLNDFILQVDKFREGLTQPSHKIRAYNCVSFLDFIFRKQVTILGSGCDYGLALLLSNLLWCGPQRNNQALQLEEYLHALRMNQVSPDDFIIIFDCTGNLSDLTNNVVSHLVKHKVSYLHITPHELGLLLKGNAGFFEHHENCRYYAMMLIFNLIISATEIYLSTGGNRISLE